MTDTEKAALERRIDELCAEVEAEKQRNAKLFEAAEKWMAKAAHFEAENAKLHADQAHWELGNCPNCPNIADLQEALDKNDKLREYAAKAWSLFIRHGAVHACDLSEVDAVRDGLRELGIEADKWMA